VINYDWLTTAQSDGSETRTLKIENGLVKVKDGGTGFMLIKRNVFERMIEAYPELYFNNDLNLPENVAKFTYLFFDCMHEQETKRYLSEDYAFCRRWQNLGGEVWLDPLVKLDHMGSFSFNGNVSKMFRRV
jgi:predicted RNA-binding protein